MKLLTEHRQYIYSPCEVVWNETIDIESWPEWAPTINKVQRLDSGPFGLGSLAKLKQPAQPETVWKVTEFSDGSYFAWEATVRGIHMRGGHLVLPTGAGCTSHMTIHVSGLMATILGPLIRKPIANAIKMENRGLKSWCEAASVIGQKEG
ncbi:MAG: SRPBCC family protein [Paracoccaceae bacterium]